MMYEYLNATYNVPSLQVYIYIFKMIKCFSGIMQSRKFADFIAKNFSLVLAIHYQKFCLTLHE